MSTQKTITTVVDPIVSARVGNDTFLSSVRTSLRNSLIELIIRVNIVLLFANAIPKVLHLSAKNHLMTAGRSKLPSDKQPKVIHPVAKNYRMAPGTSELGVAGALGFEPRLSVLETDVLPLTPCPYIQYWVPSAEC